MASPEAREPASSAGTRRNADAPSWPFLALVFIAIGVISIVDLLTAASVVVGVLLSLPIILTSVADRRGTIVLTCVVAMAGFVLAAQFGRPPASPASVWVPNRVIAFLTLPASCALALLLQARRLDAARSRDSAVAANELNRLLLSLLAHEVRSPLALAVQALDYVQQEGQPLPDPSLVDDVRARLRRNLHAIDTLLNATRRELTGGGSVGAARELAAVNAGGALSAEIEAFGPEAAACGKRITADVRALEGRVVHVDARVLKQAFVILLDNAVRHGAGSTILVSGAADGGHLQVSVTDDGAGGPAARARQSGHAGAGIGLALCEAILRHAGGSMERGRGGDGTGFSLRLPLHGAADG